MTYSCLHAYAVMPEVFDLRHISSYTVPFIFTRGVPGHTLTCKCTYLQIIPSKMEENGTKLLKLQENIKWVQAQGCVSPTAALCIFVTWTQEAPILGMRKWILV